MLKIVISIEFPPKTSKKAKTAQLPIPNESTQPGSSPLVQYVLNLQTHEQAAIGEPYKRPSTTVYLQNWDRTWAAASERKG